MGVDTSTYTKLQIFCTLFIHYMHIVCCDSKSIQFMLMTLNWW